jgi:cyanophycinase-like exopeptidase
LLGIGEDTGTAAAIRDEQRLTDVVGESAAFVVDPFTYGASGTFHGPTDTLAIHRVALHVLPPGGAGYDIAARLPTSGGTGQQPPSIAGRTFGGLLSIPAGAAPLFAAGGLSGDRSGIAASRFVAAAGGQTARLVVIATGYGRSTDAQAEAKAEAAALQARTGAPVAWFVMDARANDAAIVAAVNAASGVWLTAPDQSTVGAALAANSSVVDAIHAGWASGRLTTLFDDAAAAVLGPVATADPTPTSSNIETVSVEDFRVDGVDQRAGLGWLSGVSIEPRVLPDRHWGRLFNLLRAAPGRLGVGIDVGTAIEFGPSGATVRGSSAAVVLDPRSATFADGSNGVLGATWVIADTFADTDTIAP